MCFFVCNLYKVCLLFLARKKLQLSSTILEDPNYSIASTHDISFDIDTSASAITNTYNSSSLTKETTLDTLEQSSNPGSLTTETPLETSERESLYEEIRHLRKERDDYKERIFDMNSSSPLVFSVIQLSEEKCFLLSGLKNDVCLSLVTYLKTFVTEEPRKVPLEDQILLTLRKLRQNTTFQFLAHIRGIAKTSVIEYFWKWVDIMYFKLKFLIRMQDREDIFNTIPSVFRSKFPRVTSIIDCFEIFIESPKDLLARAQTYSNYKKHCTIKVFISCTPLGAINFISKCWGGRASDIQIVSESEFTTTKYHMPGDQILADRGFTLTEDFALNSGTELLIPAFTRGKSQLSAMEIESTRKIASVRIHIERVIGLLKNRYTILKGIIPLRCVRSLKGEALSTTLSNCDKIVTVCGSLTNLGTSIVYNK